MIELDDKALKELAHFEEVMKLVKLKPDDKEDIKTLFVNKHKYMQDKMLLRFKTTLRLFGIVAAHPNNGKWDDYQKMPELAKQHVIDSLNVSIDPVFKRGNP